MNRLFKVTSGDTGQPVNRFRSAGQHAQVSILLIIKVFAE